LSERREEMSVIGFDPGMGAIKLYGDAGGIEMLSQVAVNGSKKLPHFAGLSRRVAPMEVASADGRFYVGTGAHDHGRPVENLDYDRLTGSPEMRALLYGALTAYHKAHGLPESIELLAVGLPLETLSGEDAQRNATAVRSWLQGWHSWEADGKPYHVQVFNVLITPQPVGALFDYVLNLEGEFIPERSWALRKEVGVISVGFNTVEFLVIRDRAPLERFTAGSTSGVRRLLELINRQHQELYSLGELDAQLRAGRLDYSEALPVWAREIGGEIERRWGKAYRRFDLVLAVGGGAILLAREIENRFGVKAFIPDTPVLTTARGLYKLARMQIRRHR
jgi:hypothetical protein